MAYLEHIAAATEFFSSHEPLETSFEQQPCVDPQQLQVILARIPRIENVHRIETEKVYDIVAEKPFAIDLTDELRKIRALKDQGAEATSYWDFFRAQVEYYANESYAKLGVVEYRHELVNDNGRLKLWIEAMGKSAQDSYQEAADKVKKTSKLEWYKTRCQKEADAIPPWEAQLNHLLGYRPIVEVSPAPFDVPAEQLAGTTFGKHSFIRFHQLVYDEEGKPYIFSRAHRTNLPPDKIKEVFEIYTGKSVPSESLLGTFLPLRNSLDLDDIRREEVGIAVEHFLENEWRKLPAYERGSHQTDDYAMTKETMRRHYDLLEPALKAVFDEMCADRINDESEATFLKRLVARFQTWEKMLQARISGDWEKQEQILKNQMPQTQTVHTEHMAYLYDYYQRQEYHAEANGCGTGSGASTSESSVLGGTRQIRSGLMNGQILNAISEQKINWFTNKGECQSCHQSHKKVGLLGPCHICRSCQDKMNKKEQREGEMHALFQNMGIPLASFIE